ncbi:NAD(P)H-dependent oxidoreductase [Natribacillus halophilus]|uniref:Modulator of drug activity B n=1 Tax=Natribacillus halophilus TaxID=549003 RepID=A0A1G8SEU6_9BACI|nr:NAD(P)H-dependent oxidoreductase [Natribacillus halophilus]SDJ27721.1 modulator of drug activity B [Natribacillus halophilus]
MQRILVVNGHEYYQHSKGNLNMTLFNKIVHLLSPNYEVQTTTLQDGFNKDEEQDKMKWANVVIYQTPIYNYSVPALFKKYIDKTHEHSVYFYGNTKDYGLGGGLLTDKSYMFSTTWNAPSNAFNDSDQFFEGRKVDDVLFPLYLSHKYAGMEGLETFSCFNVKKNPDIDLYLDSLKNHLGQYFMI